MRKVLVFLTGFMLFASVCFAAGSVEQKPFRVGSSVVMIKFLCTGASDDGSIPNTAMSSTNAALVVGKRLIEVRAYPTSGGTAPDAADVFVLDENGEDLLGSADGGTTAGKGSNLIHATLKKTTPPYDYHSGLYFYPAITGAPTLKVSSQATHSATYTIDLIFE